jgi:hypothetical protein
MVLLVAAALMLSTPEAGAPKAHGQEAAILSAFKAYQAALLKKDGPRCATLVDRATIDYYQRMRDLAVKGSAADVRKLGLMDKLVVVRMRHQVPIAQLKPMDGAGALAYAVVQGWIGDKVAGAEFGAIEVDGATASGAFMVDGHPTPTRMQLHREKGAWRISLVSVFPASNFLFGKMQRESGLSEDDFVIATVGKLAGKPVPDTIWNPPR